MTTLTGTLESICTRISSGGTPSRKNAEFFTAEADGHLWVKSKELRDCSIGDTEERISEEGLNNSSAKYFPVHSVLIAMYGANVGQLGWLRRPATVNQAICGLVVDKSKADWRFVFYALLHGRGDLIIQAQGAAQQNLNQELVRQFAIPLPSLPVQRRIADILSVYDELIENNQRRIEILQRLARAIYREWFVRFRFPGHEKHSLVASPVGNIPKDWQIKPIQSLMADHIGGGWGTDAPDEDHTEPAWVIRGTDIPDARSSQVAGVPRRFHTVSNLRSRKLAKDDIVFEVSGGSKGQPVGRTLFITPELLSAVEGDVICASFCKRIRPATDRYGAELLYLSFQEGYESGEIEQYQVQSTGISNFKWTDYIARTMRAIPPAHIRSSFRDLVAPLLSQTAMLGLHNRNLRLTRDLILPRLLSGQVEFNAS